MPIGLAVAGGAGAFSRYALDYLAGDHLDPHHQVYVTLAVNVVGSLLLGLLIGVHPDGRTRIVLGVGPRSQPSQRWWPRCTTRPAPAGTRRASRSG